MYISPKSNISKYMLHTSLCSINIQDICNRQSVLLKADFPSALSFQYCFKAYLIEFCSNFSRS